MNASIETITTAALSAALTAATQRHAAVATNIAHANAEGYAPIRLGFGDHLEDAATALRDTGRLSLRHVEGLRTLERRPADSAPASVQLDGEMAELAGNAVHFQALAQGLSRHLGMLALAVTEGRR